MKLRELALSRNFCIELSPYTQQVQERCSSHKSVGGLFCDFVRSLSVIGTAESLEGKILHVSFSGDIVDNGIVGGVVGFGLLEFVHELDGVVGAFFVGGVEVLVEDLLEDVVLAPVAHDWS